MDTKQKNRRPGPAPVKSRSSKKTTQKERKLRDSDVVYTPPKPFRRGKFLLHLATVAAIVLAVLLGMSIFFKVQSIEVTGCEKYTPWDVSQASGVEMGSNLLTVSRAGIGGNIISRLPYVDKVRVGIKLPDTVNIEITELNVVYAIEDADGNWWLINDEGKFVDKTNVVTAKEYTQILGFKVEPGQIGDQAVAREAQATTLQQEDTVEGEQQLTVPTMTVPMGTTNAERLRTALLLVQHLSKNSISGHIYSINLTNLSEIEMWYEERFQISVGDASQWEYKISVLQATVNQMEEYESGHLDISFKNWPDKVGYTPFT